MPPSSDEVPPGAPTAEAPAAVQPAAPEARPPTMPLRIEDVQQQVVTLERRLATLELAYTELLTMLAAHGVNHLAELPRPPRRYEQNLRNLLPASSSRGNPETHDDREGAAAEEPRGGC